MTRWSSGAAALGVPSTGERRRGWRCHGVIVATIGMVALLLGARGPEAMAAPAGCPGTFPAAPAGLVAYGVADGGLCWTADTPPEIYLRWRLTIAGDDTIAVRQSYTPGAALDLAVRDTATGTVRWTATLARWFPTLGPPDPLPPVFRSDDGILVLPGADTGDPTVVTARDVRTGAVRWRTSISTPQERRLVHGIVESATAVYVDTELDRSGAPETVALDRRTGQVRWRVPSTRRVSAADDAVVVLGGGRNDTTGGMDVLDAATGVRRWGRPSTVDNVVVAVDGGMVIEQGPRAKAPTWTAPSSVLASDEMDGTARWWLSIPGLSGWAPSADGVLLLATTSGPNPGELRAVDISTGAQRWRRGAVGEVLAAGDGLVVTRAGSYVGAAVELLDLATGDGLRALAGGPWRVTAETAAIGNGRVLVGRAQMFAGGTPSPIPEFCRFWSELPSEPVAGVPTPGPSAFVPVRPTRLFDSRDAGVYGYRCPGERITLRVTGQAGIPAVGVSAVALNLTVTNAGWAGFVSAWPAGLSQPLASVLNLTASGQTRSNLVVLPVAADGSVSFFTQGGGHLLADVAGYFTPVDRASEGRVVALGPVRVLDTRSSPGTRLPAGGAVGVEVAGPGRPAPAGARAAVVTITATDPEAVGFVTAWAGGTAPPLASNLNVNGPGDTVANLAIVPLADDGTFRLMTQHPLHLVVDVVAYVTGPGGGVSSSGLFVPVNPARVFDTRIGDGPSLPAGSALSPLHAGVAGIAGDAFAVLVNVTATESTSPAHVRVWPSGTVMPTASSLNIGVGDTRAAATLMRLGGDGRVSYWHSSGTLHLLADALGYVTP